MGGLQELVESAWKNAKRGSGLLLKSVLVMGALSCSQSTKPENVVVSVPVWMPLLAQSIPEDSPKDHVIYPDIAKRLIFDGQISYAVGGNVGFTAYVQGSDVRVKNMLQDWNGVDTVRVYANGVEGRFLLSVMPIDDPARWQELFSQSIPENAYDGQVIYQDIDERLSDPDSPKNISVTGVNAHFEAYYEGGHIKIRNLVPNWFGDEQVCVIGNGIENHFTLMVAGQDTPTTWSAVPDVFCEEDATAGSVLLQDISNHVVDPDSPLVFHTLYDLGEVIMSISHDKLVINHLQENWYGEKRFSLMCNDVYSPQITLSVLSIDDIAYWLSLQEKQIEKNAADGTVIYTDIASRLIDPDTPKTISVVSVNPHFEVYRDNSDLKVRNLESNWIGADSVRVRGNGVEKSFYFRVTGVDVPATWDRAIPRMMVDEDTPVGTVLLSGLSGYVSDPDSPLLFQDYYDFGELKLRIRNDDLEVYGLQSNWFGEKEIVLYCNNIPSNLTNIIVNSVDDAAVWEDLPTLYFDEDSAMGTIVLADVANYVRDVDSPVTLQSQYDLAQVGLSVSEGHLVVSRLEKNWNGEKSFRLKANGVESNDISLHVGAVDDPAVWQHLDDVLLYAPSDGVVVVGDIVGKVEDIDSPKDISVVSQHPYTLRLLGNDLIIDSLPPHFSGLYEVVIDCNGVTTSFNLDIIAGTWYELLEEFTMDEFDPDIEQIVQAGAYLAISGWDVTKIIRKDDQSTVQEIVGRVADIFQDDEKVGVLIRHTGSPPPMSDVYLYYKDDFSMLAHFKVASDVHACAFDDDIVYVSTHYDGLRSFPYYDPENVTAHEITAPGGIPLFIQDIAVQNNILLVTGSYTDVNTAYVIRFVLPHMVRDTYRVFPGECEPGVMYLSLKLANMYHLITGQNAIIVMQSANYHVGSIPIRRDRGSVDIGNSRIAYIDSGIHVVRSQNLESLVVIPRTERRHFNALVFDGDVLYVQQDHEWDQTPRTIKIQKYVIHN